MEPHYDEIKLQLSSIVNNMDIQADTLKLIHSDIKLILEAATKDPGNALHDALKSLCAAVEENTKVLERMDVTLAAMVEEDD